MSRFRRRTHGVSLIELMVVMAILVILLVAIGYAFSGGLDLERQLAKSQSQQTQAEAMERRITNFLQGAIVSATATDTTTFFIGEADSDVADSGPPTLGTVKPATLSTSATGASGDSDLGCDRLIFTTVAGGVPMASQQSDDDFETQQQNFGPTGGVSEVSWGMTAQGSDPGNHTGMFERMQIPSDGDNTQGGRESVLDADIEALGFQFYNGTTWVTTWNTTTEQRRLPSEVQVSYRRKSDPKQTTFSFIVTLPTSDVTAVNPSTNGAAAL